MKRLLIVYHTQTGNTERLALAVYHAALRIALEEPDAGEVVLKRACESGIVDVLAADGILVATPENFGYMSGMIKDFFDRTFYPAEPYQLSLPYGLIVSAGNDGTGAVREIDRIMLGYPMRKVMEPLIARGEPTDKDIRACSEAGEAMMTALIMGAF